MIDLKNDKPCCAHFANSVETTSNGKFQGDRAKDEDNFAGENTLAGDTIEHDAVTSPAPQVSSQLVIIFSELFETTSTRNFRVTTFQL